MRSIRFSLLGLVAGLLCLPSLSWTYITSATLEFSADDQVSFYLNGSQLLERSDNIPFNYDVITTADGNLPLELFRDNEENVLATENFDTVGGSMQVSFRLTVNHSDGDPVVIWSDPASARFIHLSKEQKSPAGWTQNNFDDSRWSEANGVHMYWPWMAMPILADEAFAGFFGVGKVPFLVHRADAQCRNGDHNLFRQKFRFPNNPGKVQLLVNPPHARAGQQVAVSLVPGPDATSMSQFNLMAWLPPQLQYVSASAGAHYDAKLNRVHWVANNRSMGLGYLKLNAAKVVSAAGWGAPAMLLGRPKNLPRTASLWKEPNAMSRAVVAKQSIGAIPTQGFEGWFKFEEPKIDLRRGTPKIQGVVFHSQLRPGGQNAAGQIEVDKVWLNYSVNGQTKRANKKDVNIVHASANGVFTDGYYNASEDREWTWDDIKNLMVMIKAEQVGQRDRNFIASLTLSVRYYFPDQVKPIFYAKVLEPKCMDIELKSGIFRYGSKLVTSDPVPLKINEQACAPTPVPMPTATQVPIAVAKPRPTSTPAPTNQVAFTSLGLGCLSVAPDPFDFGGAFITFCLKKEAKVTVNIYNSTTGVGLRRITGTDFRAGENNQIFFNALDDKGRLLPPGTYIYELVAEKGTQSETRNNFLHIVKKRARR